MRTERPQNIWAVGKSCRGLSPSGWLALLASEQGTHGRQAGKVTGAACTHSTTPRPPGKCCSGHHPTGPHSSSWPRGHGGGRPCPQRVSADRPGAFFLRQESLARGGALARIGLLPECREPGQHADHPALGRPLRESGPEPLPLLGICCVHFTNEGAPVGLTWVWRKTSPGQPSLEAVKACPAQE